MFTISPWFHVAAHAALLIGYFLVKSRVGRSAARTIVVLCVAALAVAFIDAAAMPFNEAMPGGRVALGLLIDGVLAYLFCELSAAARGDVEQV